MDNDYQKIINQKKQELTSLNKVSTKEGLLTSNYESSIMKALDFQIEIEDVDQKTRTLGTFDFRGTSGNIIDSSRGMLSSRN